MQVGFCGTLGSCKTLSMTYFGRLLGEQTGSPVFANYKTSFAQEISTWSEILALKKGILLLDEAHVACFESRGSGDNREQTNRTHFLLQFRKKGLLLFYTTQHPSQVDKRLRNITDYMVFCSKIGNEARLQVVNWQTMEYENRVKLNDIRPVFDWYDTYEVVNFIK